MVCCKYLLCDLCYGRQSSHRDVTTHAVLAAGDEVVAEVELIVGVPKDG